MTNIGVFAAILDEENRIMLVNINYGSHNWTLPGGRLEENESPHECLKREVLEETGYIVEPGELAGVYSAPEKNVIVLVFYAKIVGRQEWLPNAEIAAVQFFEKENHPKNIHPWNIERISDIFDGRKGIYKVFNIEKF